MIYQRGWLKSAPITLACVGLALACFHIRAAELTSDEPPGESSAAPVIPDDQVAKSVVKIFSTARYPDPYQPWTKRSPSEQTGTGVVIEGKRILSNAHVVQYASRIEVQAHQSGNKIPAIVEAIAPGMDLAVLKLEDESFFDAHVPLPRAAALPQLRDMVMAYGYPEGGASLSITKGIVSRIEFAQYNFPSAGLRIQIDAAINPGNSGGPAVVDDRMIGLAYSRFGDSDNIGYIIPCEEIELFLQDVADGRYDGKPALYEAFQTLENPALRAFLKLNASTEGIVVHRPFRKDADYPLKEWDVISKIGDTPVDNQGMIKFGPNLRVRFNYLVQRIANDGKVPLTIVRAGKELRVDVPVSAEYPLVIPDLDGAYPPYFIYGPLVFSEASRQLTQWLGGREEGWTGRLLFYGSPLLKRINDKPEFDGERLVVVSSPLFPHPLARGYGNPMLQVVKAINEVPVRDLDHLVTLLRDTQEEFITVSFDAWMSETLVLPRAEVLAATEEILTDNGIRSQGSADVLSIWNQK